MASKKNRTQKFRPSSAKKDEGDALWDEVANTVKRQASSRISPVALPAKGQKSDLWLKKYLQIQKNL